MKNMECFTLCLLLGTAVLVCSTERTSNNTRSLSERNLRTNRAVGAIIGGIGIVLDTISLVKEFSDNSGNDEPRFGDVTSSGYVDLLYSFAKFTTESIISGIGSITGLINRQDVFDQLSHLISQAKLELLKQWRLDMLYARFDEARDTISSWLVDYKRIMSANEEDKQQFVKTFLQRSHYAVKELRSIPNMLRESIPGANNALLELLADNTRCNMTAIPEFQRFFWSLLSDGVLMEMAEVSLQNVSNNLVKNYWVDKFDYVNNAFLTQERKCKIVARDIIREDTNNINDVGKLWKHIKIMSPSFRSDVLFSPANTPDIFFYYIDDDKELGTSESETRVVCFGSLQNDTRRPSNTTLDKIKEDIHSKEDAKDIITLTKARLHENGLKAYVIGFFKSTRYTPEVKFDPDSMANVIQLDKLSVSFCNSFWCNVNWNNWLGIDESLSGQFNVYVLLAGEGECVIVEGGAESLSNLTNRFWLFVFVFIATLFNKPNLY